MPIFMDRHDVSDAITADVVAQIHLEDLKIQGEYDCRGLTYWFDDARKTAFCLIEAPNRDAIIQMHDAAHGQIPHQIIEVDKTIVESFLGRIENPEKAKDTTLNIINESAFRTIMLVTIENHFFKNSDSFTLISNIQQAYKQIVILVNSFNGSLVQQNEEGLLISFRTVTDAVLCALKIQERYWSFRAGYQINYSELSIGLHAGIPVTDKKSIFEDTIKLARHMCFVSAAEVVISSLVKDLFESENFGKKLDGTPVHILTMEEEKFLNSLMVFTEKEWQNSSIKVADFERYIGISKSKLYREMIRLTGKSPQVFLLHFRLWKSLQLLQQQKRNVSQVAFDSGFSSPSYYAKCFRKKYSIMPSALLNL